MKEIKVINWCDHPGCIEARKDNPFGQETREIEVWVYTPGKGRKPTMIRVEVCEVHEAELKGLYQSLSKYDMKKAVA